MARRGYTASEARICYERAEFLCNSVSGGWFPSALVGLFKVGLAVLLPASAFGFGAGKKLAPRRSRLRQGKRCLAAGYAIDCPRLHF